MTFTKANEERGEINVKVEEILDKETDRSYGWSISINNLFTNKNLGAVLKKWLIEKITCKETR